MTATNHTTNYKLSQFEEDDRPTWLGDYNSDMSKIDTAVHTVNNGLAQKLTAANIKAGTSISVTPSGNNVTIAFTGKIPEGGITSVSHDSTLDGNGTSGSPLKIANSYTSGLEAKINAKANATALQPVTLGLTAKQLDNLYIDGNNIVRVGTPTA